MILKSMISILFAICTAVVSSAMADTNNVAGAEKCRQTTLVTEATMALPGTATMAVTDALAKSERCPRNASDNRSATTPKMNSGDVNDVGGAQFKFDTCVVDCKQSESFLKYGWWIALGAIIVLAILTLVMMFGKRFAECRFGVVSMAMLVSLFGLITLCSFMWVERVVGLCERNREFFRSELTENRLSEGDAVLKAYEQLSNELSRWFAMFAVLGTFFGLVLPAGGYLLQIREIEKKKEEVNSRMKSLIDKEQGKFSKEISILWRQHSSVAQWMVMQCERRIVRFMNRKVAVNRLGGEGVGLLAWIMIVIQTALATEDSNVLSSRIEFLRLVFERLKKNEQYADFVKATIASPAIDNVKIDLEKCHKILKDKSAYDYLKQFSNEFGITMFGR